ncbi:hypothetical protein [Bacillus sp. AK128]
MEFTSEVIYTKGVGEENEDAYVLDHTLNNFAVIDGATGLGGVSGKVASQTIKEEISKGSSSLLSSVLEGNQLLGEKIVSLNGQSMESIPKYERSSCGLAAIKINEHNQMEYVHAGDCMLFIQFDDDSIRTLTFDHISRLDKIAINELTRLWSEKKDDNPNKWSASKIKDTFTKMKSEILPTLQENRNKLNEENGYSIIDGSNQVRNFIEFGTVRLHHVKKLLLLSDGLQLIKNSASTQDEWLQTATFAFEHGLKALEKRITEMEQEDPACFTYPRLKVADDKTGILLTKIS